MKLATLALFAAGLFCLMAIPLPPGAQPLVPAGNADSPPVPEETGGTTSNMTRRNAPKQIASHDLVYFHCEFSSMWTPSVPCRGGSYSISVQASEPTGRYDVVLEKATAGARFSVSCRDLQTGKTARHAGGAAPASSLDALQRILERNDTASLNGYYKSNSALGEGFRLEARYASGESINAGAEGGASVMPASGLPLGEFRRFFLDLAAKAGTPLMLGKPLQGGIDFLQYEFLLAGTPPDPAFKNLPRGIVRMYLAKRDGGATAWAGWSDPAESKRRNALIWTSFFEANVSAVWLDRLQALFDERRLGRLNGFRHRAGTAAVSMHFDPSIQAAVRIVGEWANGGSYEVQAYGNEASLPAKDYLDERWLPAFFAQLARENGLAFTFAKKP